ncbi:MAG: PAS domain S-box protein [Thermodesulfovibrionales bacterium]|nr:PAS domain S-box protein [Thermodesulfovibrionales bacterium]
MQDRHKTKDQLIKELEGLRAQKCKPEGSSNKSSGSEDLVSMLYDSTDDYITAVDTGFSILSYNKAVENQFGKGLEGKVCYEAYQARESVCPDCAVKKAIESQKHAYTFQPATSISKAVEIDAYPVFNGNGEIKAVIEHGRDVSEKMEVLERLNESNERFRVMFEMAPDAIFIADPDNGKILDINAAAIRMVGLPKEEIVGMHQSELHPPETKEDSKTNFKKFTELTKSDKLVKEEYLCRPDGSQVLVEILGQMIRLNGKSVLMGIFRDISYRRQNEKRIRSLLKLSKMHDKSEKEISDYILKESLSITGSPIGFISFMSKDESEIASHTWSEEVSDEHRRGDYPSHFPVELVGIWAEAVRKKKPLIINDYTAPHAAKKSMPDKHAGIQRLLCVPVIDKGNVVSLIATGNKAGQYTDADANQLLLLGQGMWQNISRKRAVRELGEHDRFLQALIDGASDPLLVIDMDYRIQLMNKASLEKIPVYRRARGGLHCYEISHGLSSPCQGDAHTCPIEEIKRTGKPVLVEHLHHEKIGIRNIEVAASPLLDENGNITGIIESSRDITERKKHELALKESEEKYSALYDSDMVGIAVVDIEGNFLASNMAFQEMLGYSNDKLLEKNIAVISHPDDMKPNLKLFKELVSGRKSNYKLTNKYFHNNGNIVYVDISVFGIYDEAGKFRYCYGMHKDITNEIKVSNDLKYESEINLVMAELSSLLLSQDLSIEIIARLILDSAKQLTSSKYGFVSIIDPDTGNNIAITLSDMMGKECVMKKEDARIEFPANPDGSYPGLWGHALNAGAPFYTNEAEKHEAYSGPPKGHIPIENFLACPAIAGGKLVGEIALANSEDGFSEQDVASVSKLANLFAIALLRNRMESSISSSLVEKEVLLREIHHRVKNNMAVIIAFLNLQKGAIDDNSIKDILDMCMARIYSMALVHEKLFKNDNLALINVKSYIDDLITYLINSMMHMDSLKASIVIDVDNKMTLDLDTLIPVGLLINELLTNSVKHAINDIPKPRIYLGLNKVSELYTLKFKDNGKGISETINIGRKTMGLRLINSFVKQLEGKIEVESNQHGTCYQVQFKWSAPQASLNR